MNTGYFKKNYDALYHNPVQIYDSINMLSVICSLLPAKGDIILLTTDGWVRRGGVDQLCEMLSSDRINVYSGIEKNPELDELDLLTDKFRNVQVSGIIALGGGSVIDTAKVLSVTINCAHERPLDHVFRKGEKYEWQSSIPIVAIPTTSGTGSEVTPFATVWDQKTRRKFSVACDDIFPSYVILDGSLTLSLPHNETLYTALDAISHALESIWNINSNAFTQAFAVQALTMIKTNLPIVLSNGNNIEARTSLLTASTLAGMAISQTKTAIAHSISYPLTIHHQVPHGLAAAFTLPALLKLHIENTEDNSFDGLLQSILSLLNGFELGEKITLYLNAKQLKEMASKMFDPSRAANFVHEMNPQLLASLLDSSIKALPLADQVNSVDPTSSTDRS